MLKFQSTLLQEERQRKSLEGDKTMEISIHAPTRGATCSHGRLCNRLDFNPRSYKRSDVMVPLYFPWCREFQSTLLQEERLDLRSSVYNQFIFQSTLLQEERLGGIILKPNGSIFQSTLLQEERPDKIHRRMSYTPISIHAPTRGATFLGSA